MIIELRNIHARVFVFIWSGLEWRMNGKESVGVWKLGRSTGKLLIMNVKQVTTELQLFSVSTGLIRN